MMISGTHIERKKRQDQDNAIKYYLKSSRILSLDAWKTYYSNKSQPFEIFQVWESKNEETLLDYSLQFYESMLKRKVSIYLISYYYIGI